MSHPDLGGIRLQRAATRENAAKVIARGGAPYYGYSELAAPDATSCTPQHLRLLRVVDDDDPTNPSVHWNNGHLLYQIAYFFGPANFYYRWAGESMCLALETGDSLFSLPFLQHSFAARKGGEPTYVVTLTYSGGLHGRARHELSTLGYDRARGFAMMPGSDSYAALLRSFLDAWAIPAVEMGRRTSVPAARFTSIITGESDPSPAELASIAAALSLNVRDLLPLMAYTRNGVRVLRARDATGWSYPDGDRPAYFIRPLAGDPLHPHTTAIEVRPLSLFDGDGGWLTTHQHQYAYVVGESSVRFCWRAGDGVYVTKLRQGDSVYVQPGVPVMFSPTTPPDPRLLLLRTANAISTDLRFAIGAMPPDGLLRYCRGTRLRYPERPTEPFPA
ncbi:XRE family transcriptional regulator [Phytohabitans sp. ZYX-F-186]|uniref:XRE family transcriptional regulator n=1 Tax=Phytohabitans maris TaxID=3071409 RepID=A0ABU0ZYD9_9ACTN|nr:XRE family transcriptional regulator [Phytohabitans sp. ZYX-F-186]MDQ7910987.1 XRE family transcriptional regulator [Phytohabitans sp. ZYX-F-186]